MDYSTIKLGFRFRQSLEKHLSTPSQIATFHFIIEKQFYQTAITYRHR